MMRTTINDEFDCLRNRNLPRRTCLAQSKTTHFYDVYPLACFENRKCPHRFQTALHQADHHLSAHNSQHPYYCVPCSARDENGLAGRFARMCAFKDEKALRHHGTLVQHDDVEMFLTQEGLHKPTAKSSAINYC